MTVTSSGTRIKTAEMKVFRGIVRYTTSTDHEYSEEIRKN